MRLLVNIDVSSLELAVEFYRDAIGLSLRRNLGENLAELSGADSRIFLCAHPRESLPYDSARNGRDFDRHWTPVHIDFVVDDLEVAIRRAVAAGARAEGGPREFEWGRYQVFADPFGNGFCLLEFSDGGDYM